MQYSQEYQVKDTETAAALGSGDLAVLATPALVAMVENCCKNAVTELKNTQTTVGVHISLDHLRPSKVGSQIKVFAFSERFDGKVCDFHFEAYDADELIGKGVHRRVVVDAKKFMEKLTS